MAQKQNSKEALRCTYKNCKTLQGEDGEFCEEHRPKSKLEKAVDKLIREQMDACWGYHKDIIKNEAGLTKADIGSIDLNSEGWEDVAFYEGVIHGLDLANNLIKNQ